MKDLVTGKAYEAADSEWTETEADAGKIKITGLEWGSYYLVETTPLEGYLTDQTEHHFEIRKDQLEWKPEVLPNARMQLVLPPTNSRTDQADVTGHKLRISGKFKDEDVPYIEWEETDQPYIVSGMLVEGETYTLEELSPLSGYQSAGKYQFKYNGPGQAEQITDEPLPEGSSVEIVVDEDKTVKLVRAVEPLKVRIRKEDTDGKLLAGAKLALYVENADGEKTLVAETTTSEEAWELTGDKYHLLCAGASCVLTEKSAPEGYELTGNVEFTVEDVATWQEYTMVDQRKPLTLRIQPLEFDNGYNEGLGDRDLNGKGAVYKVSGKLINNQGDPEKGEITLQGTEDGAYDQANVLKGKLIPGEVYTITEVTAPDGYLAPKPVFVKLDEFGKAVLCSEDGDSAGDSASYAKTENPDNSMDGVANKYNGLVKIYHGKTRAQLVKYTSWDGSAKKEVTDAAAYPTLSDVAFTLEGKLSGGQTSREYVTDKDGKIVFTGDLVEGETYTLKEKTPVGYKKSETITFTYQADGITLKSGSSANVAVQDKIPSLEIVNETEQNTSLQFLVYDCTDGTGLSGAKFELTCVPADGSDKKVTVLETEKEGAEYHYVTAGESHVKVTADGEVFVDDLQPGRYTLVQTKAPYGYSLSEEGITITFTVDETAKNRTIEINEKNVQDHAYGLTATDNGPKVVGRGICNKRIDGTAEIEKRDYDDDTLLNGVGYELYRYDEADQKFVCLKQLETGKAYEAAEQAGTETGQKWTETAADAGTLRITGLEWGTYYIVETKPLAGYLIDETKHNFEIGKDRPTQVLEWKPAALTNSKIQLILPPTKSTTGRVDVTGHKMRIRGKFLDTDAPYIEWEETDQPYIVSGKLIVGEIYTLEEASVLPGYDKIMKYEFRYNGPGQLEAITGDSSVEIVVDEDGTVRLVRKAEPLKLRIRKTDEDGKLLAGAELALYVEDAKGTRTLVAKTTTGKKAWELTGDQYDLLCVGATCILTEKNAPEGYELAEDVTFTVQSGTTWQEYAMIDKRQRKQAAEQGKTPDAGQKTETTDRVSDSTAALPKTGREERTIYYVIGGIFVAAGVLLLCVRRKKKK